MRLLEGAVPGQQCWHTGTSEAATRARWLSTNSSGAITACAHSPRQNTWPRLQGLGPRGCADKDNDNFYPCCCWSETEESTCRSLCHGHCAVPSSLSQLSRADNAEPLVALVQVAVPWQQG